MQSITIELVEFRTFRDMSDESFLKTVEDMADWLKMQPGFISRRLSKTDNGIWVDHLEWASLEEAKTAAEVILTDDAVNPFIKAIDPSTTRQTYSTIEHRLM